MSQIIYIDTCVWLDYLLNRTDKLHPLGDFAFELLRKSKSCQYEIIVSENIIAELAKYTNAQNIRMILESLQEKITFTLAIKDDLYNAKLRKTHFADAIHGCIALRMNADYIVTRNIKDFSVFSKEISVAYPEQL